MNPITRNNDEHKLRLEENANIKVLLSKPYAPAYKQRRKNR